MLVAGGAPLLQPGALRVVATIGLSAGLAGLAPLPQQPAVALADAALVPAAAVFAAQYPAAGALSVAAVAGVVAAATFVGAVLLLVGVYCGVRRARASAALSSLSVNTDSDYRPLALGPDRK